MKYLYSIIFFSIYLSSKAQILKHLSPVEAPAEIQKSIMNWLYYEDKYILWSADYTTLDTLQQKISKKEFLDQLATGRYMPLRVMAPDTTICYQLYKLSDSADKEIGTTIKFKALQEYRYYQMEGLPLPKFRFVDLNNELFNDSTVKGKILVINCWFIHCQPCLEEIPLLNQLAKTYSTYPNILFIGLAFDSAKNLKIFLKKTKFTYSIIPDQEDYLRNELQISGYPAHLIVSGEGKIVKIIDGKLNAQKIERINELINLSIK